MRTVRKKNAVGRRKQGDVKQEARAENGRDNKCVLNHVRVESVISNYRVHFNVPY